MAMESAETKTTSGSLVARLAEARERYLNDPTYSGLAGMTGRENGDESADLATWDGFRWWTEDGARQQDEKMAAVWAKFQEDEKRKAAEAAEAAADRRAHPVRTAVRSALIVVVCIVVATTVAGVLIGLLGTGSNGCAGGRIGNAVVVAGQCPGFGGQ